MGYYEPMDSARRKPLEASPKTTYPFSQNTAVSGPKRQEELFVTREESELMDKHEKNFRKRIAFRKIFYWLLALVAIVIVSYGLYFSWKIYAASRKMNSQSQEQKTTLTQYVRALVAPIIPTSKHLLRGEETGRVNILLLGAAGEHKPGGNLTDTVMVMSIDMKNKKVALLSLPRDLYVQIPGSANYTKINSLYPIGINEGRGAELIKKAVENITGVTVNYYMAVDFAGFQKIIDDIGGINIISERDIYDQNYPGPNYSYETFSLSKGFHALDGATALQYVRERHDDPQGDFGRAKRQQQVIQAVKNKLFSVRTFFNVIAMNNIIDALGESIKTDIAFEDIDRFITLSKQVDLQNITNVVADAWKKDSLLKVSHVTLGNTVAFILVPRVGNYSEIQDLAQNIFDQAEIKRRQDAISAENASIGIINESSDSQLAGKIQSLLKDKLEMKNVRILQNSQKSLISQTTVSDNSQAAKLFTLDELVKKLPASLASSSEGNENSTNYDIVITLGSDLADIYKYGEDTMQDLQNAEQDNQIPLDFSGQNQ